MRGLGKNRMGRGQTHKSQTGRRTSRLLDPVGRFDEKYSVDKLYFARTKIHQGYTSGYVQRLHRSVNFVHSCNYVAPCNTPKSSCKIQYIRFESYINQTSWTNIWQNFRITQRRLRNYQDQNCQRRVMLQ